MNRVTAKSLADLDACEDQVDVFRKVFPRGTEVTAAAIRKAHAAGLDVDWWATLTLRDSPWAAYMEATEVPEDAYEEAIAAAWAAYNDEATVAADAAIRRATVAAYAALQGAKVAALIEALGLEKK